MVGHWLECDMQFNTTNLCILQREAFLPATPLKLDVPTGRHLGLSAICFHLSSTPSLLSGCFGRKTSAANQ
jgi:hypothetical protein